MESGYQCTLNVGTSEPGIRDWVLFDHWIRDPGSGIGFFRILDPAKTIFLRAFVYLSRGVKYGRIAKNRARRLWSCTPFCTSKCKVYAACRLSVCLRGLTATFSCVQPADNQAFPPTHPRRGARRAAGEAARLALLSIFPPFPGNLSIKPIYPHS